MPEPLTVHAIHEGPHAGVHTIILEQPGKPVVVLDLDLIQRLEATLLNLPKAMRGVVLASASDRSFVAGADLKSIQALDDDQLHRYLEYGSKVFGMLGQLPCPTAAAIAGAALGGGLELAMHCDALIGAPSASGKPYPVGLPEAGLCICPGWGGTNLLPARLEPADAIRRTAVGETMMFDDAAKAGLFDAVAPSAAEVVEAARRWVVAAGHADRDGAPSRWIGRTAGPGRFRAGAVAAAIPAARGAVAPAEHSDAVFDCVEIGLSAGWQAALAAERRHLVRLRNTPAGKGAIEAFFARSKK